MRRRGSKDVSIIWTSFLMKIVGLWLATDRNEQRQRDFALIYTVGTLFISICIAFRDIYYSWGNFSNSVFICCNILYVAIVLLKISVLYAHREEFFNLIAFTQKNFWRLYDDPQELLIITGCKKLCNFSIVLIIFCAQGTCAGYMVTPLIENIGKNESDRALPFNLWIDFPVGLSPYFELLFILQILCVYHVATCYICFDNLLCIVNLHVAGQFRILQHRLKNLGNAIRDETGLPRYEKCCYERLKDCVVQHQTLIEYCKRLEDIFTVMVLGQVMFLAVVICLVGFQLFLADTSASKKASLVLNLGGTFFQLLIFTYSCDNLIRQSVNVGNAVFSGPWVNLPMSKAGILVRKNLIIVIMRSQKICCLTAGKFFPVSLETSTAVLSTAISYFTLLKQSSLENILEMKSKEVRDLSITVTAFYMKIAGFWTSTNYVEERRRNVTMSYTLFAILFAATTEARDLYFSWGNFSDSIYVACNIITVSLVLIKLLTSFIYNEELLGIIRYAKTNFWHSNYDTCEKSIMNKCQRTCNYLVFVFTFFAQGTVLGFILRPILVNRGKNESDRILPFNMWLELPLSITPYFEVMFFVQVVFVYHVCVCYHCFDSLLCILNLHTASQFRILQHRFANTCNEKRGKRDEDEESALSFYEYSKLKAYIRQHQALIEYCKKLEQVFNSIVFGQVLLFSLLMCLDGYLILMEETPFGRRVTFTFHITGCMCQLLMFTYSCDCLIRDSMDIADAAYNCLWSFLPMNKYGKMIRRDLMFVITRSRTPCCLTACGFFAVSLETYTKILSTAMSYFTLLRNQSENAIKT
ncbi:uncharacterized protein LOC724202 [Apis mellifera]|uniref:Uncharacterized protein LOC724202 n=1 Tax=Apis mellifera TaxID=7460 RepID=A0A7M7MSC0_APIME|nr:uncharacterized protein LOC724202 [Apis mellifera]|eukprot:XP_026300224.1 uncharacterized protein LOC724202 [Apis mellifera]